MRGQSGRQGRILQVSREAAATLRRHVFASMHRRVAAFRLCQVVMEN